MKLKSEAIISKIEEAIGKPVAFQYDNLDEPGTDGRRRKDGVLKDRKVVGRDSPGISYWHVVDLIEFPDVERLRFGYYRASGDHVTWASRTALTTTVADWKKLFVEAAKEKPWFKKL